MPTREEIEAVLRRQLGTLRAKAAAEGLDVSRIIAVLREALAQEERYLEVQRVNERSYR